MEEQKNNTKTMTKAEKVQANLSAIRLNGIRKFLSCFSSGLAFLFPFVILIIPVLVVLCIYVFLLLLLF